MSGEPTGIETELDVGTMIAAGIFVLSGLAVSNVGAMAIIAFLIAGDHRGW